MKKAAEHKQNSGLSAIVINEVYGVDIKSYTAYAVFTTNSFDVVKHISEPQSSNKHAVDRLRPWIYYKTLLYIHAETGEM